MERELAESLVGTGTSDWVDEEIAEVFCETWEGSGMAVRELGNNCQEDLVQSSCEMESHLCAEEEQAGIGCGFERLDWYRYQWGKSEG